MEMEIATTVLTWFKHTSTSLIAAISVYDSRHTLRKAQNRLLCLEWLLPEVA